MGKSTLRAVIARRFASFRTAAVSAIAVTVIVSSAITLASSSGGASSQLDQVRGATDAFHNLDIAMAAGYDKFYICTDKTGTGAMGQHFVKGDLVADPALDKLRPEVLVYEPRADGGYQLVALEYVVLKADWQKANGNTVPRLLGRKLELVTAPNRYGLPDFYELHVWLWKNNPRGMFDDWNPRVSCRGHGDPA